jgi:hypothetical protein
MSVKVSYYASDCANNDGTDYRSKDERLVLRVWIKSFRR